MQTENKAALEQPRTSIAQGATLPDAWYTDEAVLDREIAAIFDHGWHYVGFRGHLAEPGDFVTTTVGRTPVVATRGTDGILRAFVNVCRHRGSEVVREPFGRRKTLQCHYHAWTYNLDGSLRAAPRSDQEPGFDPTLCGLTPLRVGALGPFVFVTLDADAPDLEASFLELPQVMAASGLDFDAIVFHERRTYDLAANWKVLVENFLECYHCPGAHPSFTKLIDLDEYDLKVFDAFSTFNGPVTHAALAANRYAVADESTERQRLYNFALWPNFMANVYPGPGNLSTNLILPLGPNRTLAVYDFFFEPHVSEEVATQIVEFVDLVQQEDIVLCESVQRGMRSGRFGQGTLFQQSEMLIQHFDQQVEKAVAADGA